MNEGKFMLTINIIHLKYFKESFGGKMFTTAAVVTAVLLAFVNESTSNTEKLNKIVL